MYHIKNDKRAHGSAELICEGLARCLEKKEYSEISISDISKQTGVARSTFYRLFDTLDDVLLYQFNRLFDECLKAYRQEKNVSYARLLLEFVMDNKTLAINLIKSGRSDIFANTTVAWEHQIVKEANLNLDDSDLRYITEILNQLAVAVLRVWINEGCVEETEALYQRLKRELNLICDNL